MSALGTLVKKEVTEVVRDRRTLFLTLAMPLLLYPAVMLGMGTVILAGKERLKNEELTVAFASDAAEKLFEGHLPAKTKGVRMPLDGARALLADKRLDAIVDVAPDAQAALDGKGQVVVQLLYTKRFDRSEEALDRLRPVVQALNDGVLKTRLVTLNLDAGFVTPVKLEAVDVDFQKDLGPLIAASLLPVTLLVWLIAGAMNSAVDLVAGEKERGTLETLLVSAVRPRDVLFAKALVVLGLAIASTLTNLLAMAGTFAVGVSSVPGLTLSYHFTPGQVLTMLAALLPAAVLVTGLAVAVASLARTQREGQTWMGPLMLVGMTPAVVVQMPGIELDPVTAVVPMLNVALLVKGVILNNAPWPYVAETIGSVLLFSALAGALAVRVFDSELARLGGTASVASLLKELWRPKASRP
jgi:sodium transport system permease protein